METAWRPSVPSASVSAVGLQPSTSVSAARRLLPACAVRPPWPASGARWPGLAASAVWPPSPASGVRRPAPAAATCDVYIVDRSRHVHHITTDTTRKNRRGDSLFFLSSSL